MSTTQRYQHHERLMAQMADANGVDLDLEMQKGALSPDLYEAYVHNCTGCSNSEGCQAHLTAGRAGFPSFCRNADALQQLSEATPSSE